MIVTITPNPAIDITMRVTDVVWGESNRVAPSITRAGGKGLNVARVLTQTGVAAHALAAVGHDDLRAFSDDLESVPHTLIEDPNARTRRSIAVVEDPDAVRVTVFNEAGHVMTEAVWTELLAATTDMLEPATCLVMAGSTPPDFPLARVAEVIAHASSAGVPVIADLSGPAMLVAADHGATLLKPNRRELREATGEPDPVAGARMLIARGAGIVIVSLGEDGMLLVQRDRDATLRAHGPVISGNPTGAGDAAVASLAAHLSAGETNAAELLARAATWATAAVLAPGAGTLAGDLDAIRAAITIIDDDVRRTA